MNRHLHSMRRALILVLLTTGAADGLASYTLPSSVVSGGGEPSTSSSYRLQATTGQAAAIGPSNGPTHLQRGGFWNLGVVDTDAPTVTFLLPGTYTRLNVPITQLTASDSGSSISGFYLSTSSTPPDPFSPTGWQSTAPSEVVAAGEGPSTFHAWARDEAGNLSGDVSATTDITLMWLLSVSLAGTGGTSVTSTPAAIACLTGNSGVCSANFHNNATVTLAATSAWNAKLAGWSACGGSGDCPVIMNADRSVTATFAANTNVRLNGAPPTLFSKITDAYDAIVASGTIQAQTFAFLENLYFSSPVTVLLEGGKDAAFNQTTGFTTVEKLIITSGSVRARNIKIK